jgi:hypothetical protein
MPSRKKHLLIFSILLAVSAPTHARCRRPVASAPAQTDPAPDAAFAKRENEPKPAEISPFRNADESPPVPRSAPDAASAKESDPPRSLAFAVSPGESLRAALARWTESAGWTLVWDASSDYSLSAAAVFPGDMRQAVAALMESLKGNGAPFGAEIWTGNRVVRVTKVR